MTGNLTSLLAEKSYSLDSDKVMLWHATNDANTLKSFLDNGAKAIGKGFGGQTDGFYVWSKKRGANSHFSHFLATDDYGNNTVSEGLLIGTQIKKNDVTYPNWQFDLELGKVLNPLLFKYKDQIKDIKNLEYVDEYGDKISVLSIEAGKMATTKACTLRFRENSVIHTMRIGETGPGYLAL